MAFKINTEAEDEARPEPIENPGALLANEVVSAALRTVEGKLLGQPGVVAIVVAPTVAWADAAHIALDKRFPQAAYHMVTEKKKSPLAIDPGPARYFATGRSVIVITHDPEVLAQNVRVAADVTITLPPPSGAAVRKVIRAVTGKRALKLVDADVAHLDFGIFEAAIRPGSSAGACVKRLRNRQGAALQTSGPTLSELPVFGDAATWATEMLADAKLLIAGEISTSQIEGTLLFGPPGTGKTTIASAFAVSAGMNFVPTSVARWFSSTDGHLGSVLKAAEQFFMRLSAEAPCVGFLDELDALQDRSTMSADKREWWSSVVSGVLIMVSETLASSKPIILIAATNLPDQIDAALTRPGRFGRHVLVRAAETEDEVATVLRYQLAGDLEPEAIGRVAAVAGLPTAAQMEKWVKAARRRARGSDRAVIEEDLMLQVAPEDDRPPDEIHGTALHEAAHVVAGLLFGLEPVRVSIVVADDSGGHVEWHQPRGALRMEEIEERVIMSLSGRAADALLGAGPDTGARFDLEIATDMLVAAEIKDGLLGRLTSRGRELKSAALLNTDVALLKRTEETLQRLMSRAAELVDAHRIEIIAIAEELVKKRILSGDEVKAIFAAFKTGSPHPPDQVNIADSASDDPIDATKGAI